MAEEDESLLELLHAAATNSTPTSRTAPDRTGLRARNEDPSDVMRGTVADLVVSPRLPISGPSLATTGKGDLSDAHVAAYVARYATRDADVLGTIDCSLPMSRLRRRRPPLRTRFWLVPALPGPGARLALRELRVSVHVFAMIEKCWQLGGVPDLGRPPPALHEGAVSQTPSTSFSNEHRTCSFPS